MSGRHPPLLVLDANILIRAVLGKRVRELVLNGRSGFLWDWRGNLDNGSGCVVPGGAGWLFLSLPGILTVMLVCRRFTRQRLL